MTTKTCSKCFIEKTLDRYGKRRESADGYNCVCKDCFAKYSRDWKNRHIEQVRSKNREYHHANSEKRNSYVRANREGLTDQYVKYQLRKSMYTKDIPPELIPLVREQIKLKRLLKELKNEKRK